MTPQQRKSAPALYELVGNGKPRAETARVRPKQVEPDHKPEPTPKPQPQPRPTPQPAPAAAGSGGGGIEGEFGPGGSVRMPAGVIFFIVFGVIAALFAGYLIGYQQKAREVETREARDAVNGVEYPDDPLNAGPVNPDLLTSDRPADRTTDARSRARSPENRPAQRPERPESRRSGPGAGPLAVIIEPGDEDPREPDLNYLAITQVGAGRVNGFLDHLAANGVDAAAYPVNDGSYRIYALRGFTREQYRTDRRPFQDAVQRLTESYKDASGRGVVYDAYWEKHNP